MKPFKHAEDDCSLSKFIKYLDEAKGSEPIDFENEINITDEAQKHNVLLFFTNLKEIYSSITTDYLNITNQCCSYLNFWLDKDFMVYCVNRDELKHKCQQNDDGLKSTYCDNFNKYTNHYYTHFTKNVTCLSDTNNDIHPNWKFSDTCTLHDMAKTFPKYETSSQTIVDDTSRGSINKCEDPEAL
ncbi:hypothetical protein PVT01_000108800 [Plasmodium vivax]|uniref:PIR Superfamily Protein n=1 Tax=Plasmodium vivax TaxID=5855 RepID=A0A1G4EIV9_PLAVI|nr:hypothetical protein PVT01_000108800 [Plasmodium vivax]